MQLFGIRTRMIKTGDDLVKIVLEALRKQEITVENGDILAVASKIVATVEGRIRELASVKTSAEAKRWAEAYDLEPSFVEVVLQESDEVYGGVSKALLTLKNNGFTINAGVDHKNAPEGNVALWPKNPQMSAEDIRRKVFEKTGKKVGVLVVDSMVNPRRMGTTGFALGVAGFRPVRDYRRRKDLYGNSIYITRHALADDIASAAHLIMGESSEQTPIVLVRDAPVKLSEKVEPKSMVIPKEQCLFGKLLEKNRL